MIKMWEYNYTNYDELYHFGIKGMKWGVRRFQNKDGSLTSAGKKRYDDSDEAKKLKGDIKNAKAAYKKAKREYDVAYTKAAYVPTPGHYKQLEEAKIKMDKAQKAQARSKLDYRTGKEVARIRENNVEFKNKSKHRLKLEEQYKKLGLTDEQAQAAANNRIRTEKLLVGAAGLSIAAAAAYAYHKRRKEGIDSVIKAGEKLQRVEMLDTNGKLNGIFYASKGDHDNKRYATLLGFARQQEAGASYIMELQANKDVKVASKDKAVKVFGELFKNDSDFAGTVTPYVEEHFNGVNKIRGKALTNPSDRDLRKMYDNFNSALVELNKSPYGGSTAANKFYDALKKQGYGAIQDVNDMKFSGYAAKNPLIVFDNAGDNIMVKSMKEMREVGVNHYLGELGKAMVEQTMDRSAGLAAGGFTVAAATTFVRDDSKRYATNQEKK